MQEQMDRIELKLDKALIEHHGRLVKLETQAGFIRWAVTIAISLGLALFSWVLSKFHA